MHTSDGTCCLRLPVFVASVVKEISRFFQYVDDLISSIFAVHIATLPCTDFCPKWNWGSLDIISS